MCAVCDKYSLKLLTYGSFVSQVGFHIQLSSIDADKSAVWWLIVEWMARSACPGTLLRHKPANPVTKKGVY